MLSGEIANIIVIIIIANNSGDETDTSCTPTFTSNFLDE